ncbi:FadR family transcriptional regulator [Sandaracinobacter neustonicus]|uniref:FadR family transcriptional regulator n=1 Tax=Sandaracinobacter neustonicus TaxID=1715348 RepID=A0A501XM80_9SPHN|nr:GntR family transcriptional regulator [Sandaracinobacter neustonicus]TPE61549.1 FadR family transcriptional regulator [Sandaracinobacter neustonicus]
MGDRLLVGPETHMKTVSRQASGRGVTVRKVSQIVAEELRGDIARGDIKDGDLLPPEPELAQRFGVSRPTLREAIRILETEGLVTTTRGGRKGAKVHHPSSAQAARVAGLVLQLRRATVTDVFELAALLVPAAARKVAELDPPADLSRLEAIYAALEREADHPRELARLIREFDLALCDLSGNEVLKLVSQMMAEIINLQINTIPESSSDLPVENARDIAPSRKRLMHVLDAIRDRDGVLAESLLRSRMGELLHHHQRVVEQSNALSFVS